MTGEGTLASWGNALTVVAACGVVGVFIDFYIGKPGQQRVPLGRLSDTALTAPSVTGEYQNEKA